jgi:hypothetical protein
VIDDESAGVAGPCAEVLDIEVERLDDARREENAGAAWNRRNFSRKHDGGRHRAQNKAGRQAKEA